MHNFNLFADYFQFYLQDAAREIAGPHFSFGSTAAESGAGQQSLDMPIRRGGVQMLPSAVRRPGFSPLVASEDCSARKTDIVPPP